MQDEKDIDLDADYLSPHDPRLDDYYESFEFASRSGNSYWLKQTPGVTPAEKLRNLIVLAKYDISEENYVEVAKVGRLFLEVVLKSYYELLLPDCIGISYVRMIDYCWARRLIEQPEYDHLQAIRKVAAKGVCDDHSTSLSEVEWMVEHMEAELDLYGFVE